jgi:hypothetical protein
MPNRSGLWNGWVGNFYRFCNFFTRYLLQSVAKSFVSAARVWPRSCTTQGQTKWRNRATRMRISARVLTCVARIFCLRDWWEGNALDRELRFWNSAARQSLAAGRRQPGLLGCQLTTGNGLVGARGFEPPTPCAQGRCATRLRYAPTASIIATILAPASCAACTCPACTSRRDVSALQSV